MRIEVSVCRLCFLFLTSSLVCVHGADFYVSTQGNDTNPGSSGQPFRTITRAYRVAGPGVTIHVLPGVYNDYSSGWGLHLGASGSASSPIVLRSEIKGGAVIDGQNASDRNEGIYLDGSYNVIDGFEIRGGPNGGITIHGNGNQILNNEIHHNGNPPSSSTNGRDGVYSNEGTRDNIYLANYIHDNGRPGSNLDHGLYLCGANEAVLNNILVRNVASGLQIAGYTTVSNMKVYNNVIAWNGTCGIILWQALSGVDIKNNILYQNGHYGLGSFAATGSGVVVDHNLSYSNAYGNYDFSGGGSTYAYTAGSTISVAPLFVNSTATGFDAHLGAGSPAINGGMNLSAFFSTDKDGVGRPASGAWDLGAYRYGNSDGTPPAVSLSAPANNATVSGASVAVSANASDNVGVVAVQFKLDGANLGAEDTSAPYGVTWDTTTTANGAHTLSAVARDAAGNQATASSFSIMVNNSTAPPPSSGLSFAASSGTISAPFIVANGTLYQAALSSVTGGGRAVYSFSIINAGNYTVSAQVYAPNDGANSFFVNIDTEPTDPLMIWDVPIAASWFNRTVSWRGSGTADSDQFVPKVFNLTAGTHQLIVRGREANCRLGAITIAPPSR